MADSCIRNERKSRTGIGSGGRGWLGRAQHEHIPLAPACADAVGRRDARGVRRCRIPAEYAGFRGRAGARGSRLRRHSRKRAAAAITKACRAESFDLAVLAEAATRSGNLAIPLVKALTADVAKADARCGALRALGRHQPGRDRHRHDADAPRRRSTRLTAISSGRWRALPDRPGSIATPRWLLAPGCSTRCRCRSD